MLDKIASALAWLMCVLVWTIILISFVAVCALPILIVVALLLVIF